LSKVPLIDIPRSQRQCEFEILSKWKEIFQSGRYILGNNLTSFENLFANYCQRKYAIGTNSGTDALLLSLMSLGVGKGDEVIVPAFTFFATAAVVERVGAKTVFADVEEETYMIDVDDLTRKITAKTKAIIPVHLFGQSANIQKLIEISSLDKLLIIEDASQAAGAEYRGRKIGSFGDISCFSFYPTKNLSACGDSGIVLTDNSENDSWIRKARNHGMIGKTHDYNFLGINSRMDELQAAALATKLSYLDEWNNQRKNIAKRYLAELEGIHFLRLQIVYDGSDPTWNKFCIRVLCNRENLRKHLASEGVDTEIYYPNALTKTAYFSKQNYDCPVAERLQAEILAIPCFPGMNSSEQDRVISAIKSYKGD